MGGCRNCGRNGLRNLGPIGRLNPFFLKRALGIELRVPRSPNAAKQKIRDLAPTILMSLLSRVTSQAAFVEMELCESCSFIQTTLPFHDDDIMRLYVDYRSPSYTRQRVHYEPTYAGIAEAVGYDPVEVRTRTSALNQFLRKELTVPGPLNMLDYGGSDGRFMPNIPGSKFVYEVSDIPPIAGVTRIKSESELGLYALVLLAHVTEHVTRPLELVRKISAYVEPGGHLYIETPEEISDQQRDQLRREGSPFDIPLHEHINSYSVPALRALLEAAGFVVVAMEKASVDLGWVKGVHLRALGRKPATSES